jgi:hypothetical protein
MKLVEEHLPEIVTAGTRTVSQPLGPRRSGPDHSKVGDGSRASDPRDPASFMSNAVSPSARANDPEVARFFPIESLPSC